jgi:hypothetical protein
MNRTPIAYSQFQQDLWVLSYFKKGIFVDVGFNDGMALSNTNVLDVLGWKGLGIDPFPRNYSDRINTIVEIGCVYKEQKEIEFICAGDWGGIYDTMNSGKNNPNVIKADRIKIMAYPLEYYLIKHNFPSKIQYLSLDTEGSEYEILSVFPFHKYTFGCITYEHNYEETKRSQVRQLLESQGYIFDKQLEVDDCFVHSSVKDGTF